MKKIILILIVLAIAIPSFATIKEVKQDSTGQYIHIQDAIIWAIDGDTILVWPGIYYENVDLIGKSITLASLTLTTGDISYKYSTVINGKKTGTCILIIGSDNVVINGLTLTNGSGYLIESIYDSTSVGGGIYCLESNLDIINCIVTENKTNTASGGIQIRETDLFLSGTSIFNNWTLGRTGGIGISSNCTLDFDPVNRCSIYNNSAERSCDISTGIDNAPIHIVLDTFSVLTPLRYFVSAYDINGYPQDDFFTFDILNQNITPYDGDLYVDPVAGNDTNSGTNPNDALKTIFSALSKIVEDSINKNTIHLLNGVYSDTTNGEKFPLNVRSNVNMEGESMAGVIWDGRDSYRFLMGNNCTSGYSFKKITMRRGRHKFKKDASTFFFYFENSDILLDSITVTESVGYGVVANFINCNNAVIKNSVFSNNRGGNSAVVAGLDSDNPLSSYEFINCKFINNMPDYENPEYPGGGGLSISGSYPIGIEYENPTKLVNCLFSGNNDNGLGVKGCPIPYIVNCTFVDNCLLGNGVGLFLWWGADAHIFNSIFYNNGQWPFIVSNWETSDTAHLEIYNSLVDGGEESITLGRNGSYYYDPTNIDTIPNFLGMWGDPYMLADNSPCINTGTLENLPEFIELPEFDLAGNPRVVGGYIDMGAYEWNPTIVGFNEIGPGSEKEKPKLLTAAPNPFLHNTTISINYESRESTKVEIYDNFGTRVKTLITSNVINGNHKVIWNGNDNNGNQLPNGIYFAVMFYGDKEVENLKIVKR